MITVVWDVDDVLNDLMRQWFTLAWLPEHADVHVAFDELRANPPDAVLGVTREAYLASLDAFRHEEACRRQPPRAEVRTWFEEQGDRCRHVALTAVPLHAAALSAEWVLRIYGRWIRCFGVVPSPRLGDPPGGPADKAEWLAWFGDAEVFVDDSEDNVDALRARGVHSVLFPSPWNSAAGRPMVDALAELSAVLDAVDHDTGCDERGAG